MKKACIISVGNELLSGQNTDTNASHFSRELLSLGIPVAGFYTVGDEVDSISESIKSAANKADIVLITGGLGPTDDDVTRYGLADFLGVELKFNEKLFLQISKYFANRKYEMPEKNRIQACIPAGTKGITNNAGTAPGIMAFKDGKILVLLPGVPVEAKLMFSESVSGQIASMGKSEVVITKKIKCFGVGESKIAEMLGDLMNRQRNPLINCTVSGGIITLYIVAHARDRRQADEMIENDATKLHRILGDFVYGRDDQTLAQVVGKQLVEKNLKLALAESCTGGLIAKMITDSAGASRYFTAGLVTYSNRAKVELLGIDEELIEKNGAVSGQVAEAMVEAVRQKTDVDMSIAVTGIAGPSGGSADKPIGLVYIALNMGREITVQRYVFSGGREHIRERTALSALNMLRMGLAAR
jgi:nicotinamide-nucleotide amidase